MRVAAISFGFLALSVSTAAVGVHKDLLKGGIGPLWHYALDSNSYNVAGEIEYMMTEQNGVTAGGYFSVSQENDATKSFMVYNGINLHFFPGDALDAFMGGRGGFTTVTGPATGQAISPTIVIYLAATWFIQDFYTEIEAGYGIFGYAKEGETYVNYSAPRVTLRMGYSLTMD